MAVTHFPRAFTGLTLGVLSLFALHASWGAGSDPASRLLVLAQAKFGQLSEVESVFFKAAADGEIAVFDDVRATLSADRVAWLCTNEAAATLVSRYGIWLRGGRIDGELILSNSQIRFPLTFEKTVFSKGIALQHAHLPMLVAERVVTQEIHADGLVVDAGFLFRNGSEARGEVRLVGASIGGNLDCSGTKFIGKGQVALGADRLVISRWPPLLRSVEPEPDCGVVPCFDEESRLWAGKGDYR